MFAVPLSETRPPRRVHLRHKFSREWLANVIKMKDCDTLHRWGSRFELSSSYMLEYERARAGL